MLEIFNRVFEQLRNAWRFRWLALVVAWAVAVCGWVLVYSLPDQYESDALVHIDTQSAIHPLLKGMAVQPNVDRQVDLLVRTVLSRPNLETIARRTGLDLKASTPDAMERLTAGLEQRIKLRSTSHRLDLYTISFTSSSAATAQNVVQEVINVMTGMAAGDGGRKSSDAMAFLNREVEMYKDRLDDAERRLTKFKKDNAQLMPGEQDYVTRVQNLTVGIDETRDQLAAAREHLRGLGAGTGGTGSRSVTISPENTEAVRSLDQRIAEQKNRLGQLLGKYTPKHPDVQATQREIARLQDKRADKIADFRANPQTMTVAAGGGSYRAELNAAKEQVTALEASLDRKQQRLQQLQSGADEMSEAQTQLAQLTRTYQNTRDRYEKLLDRLYTARLSEDVDRSSNPLEFRVIDPPEAPSEASGPNRLALITAALLGSLAAGGLFAFLMSQMRPVFISRRALTDATNLPVLGSVSVAWTRAQSIRRRTAFLVFMMGVGVLMLFYAGAVAFAPMGVRIVPSFISGQWL